MFNQKLLKAKIIAQGFTRAEIAKKMGISLTTLNYKLNGRQEFKLSEMKKICTILNLNKSEREKIFFA
jgi:transcriptional regulator with XRE-family HTH domain